MRFSSRKPNFRKMYIQLDAVAAGLRAFNDNGKYLPSPKNIERLAYMRWTLKELPALAEAVEKEAWRRVDIYIKTPYTPAQLLWRNIAGFFGWWLAASFGIAYSVLGWFVSWFPSPFWMLATSAAIGFFGVAWIAIQERGSGNKNGRK